MRASQTEISLHANNQKKSEKRDTHGLGSPHVLLHTSTHRIGLLSLTDVAAQRAPVAAAVCYANHKTHNKRSSAIQNSPRSIGLLRHTGPVISSHIGRDGHPIIVKGVRRVDTLLRSHMPFFPSKPA